MSPSPVKSILANANSEADSSKQITITVHYTTLQLTSASLHEHQTL